MVFNTKIKMICVLNYPKAESFLMSVESRKTQDDQRSFLGANRKKKKYFLCKFHDFIKKLQNIFLLNNFVFGVCSIRKTTTACQRCVHPMLAVLYLEA